MDRLTTEKPVKEMTMTELSLNGCYIDRTGWARYRDYDTDIDARDFVRKLLERYEPEQPIPEESGDLEQLLFDELQYGALDHAGSLVALVYMMIVSMAELRAHLAAYEDTGLDPEEVKSVKETFDLFGGPDGIQRAFMERDKYLDALLGNQGRGQTAPPIGKRQRVEICRAGDNRGVNELLKDGWRVLSMATISGFQTSDGGYYRPYTEYLLEREEADDGH